jgi:photosystem II stability/assembly factor-like uncharacterized protein
MMTANAAPLPFDPLIAEAKERARRRRLLALGMLVAVTAGAMTYGLLPSGSSGVPGNRSLPKSLAARLELAARDRDSVWEAGGAGGGVFFAQADDALWLTANGGRTWRAAPHGVGGDGNIDFVDHRSGWIQQSQWLYRTTDGGRSWTRAQLPGTRVPGTSSRLPDFARDMSFINRTVGFLTTSRGYPHGGLGPNRLLATGDGGVTWHARGPLPSGAFFAQFDNARRGFTRTASAVYSTTDGGRTWSLAQPSPPCSGVLEGGRFGGTVQIWRCGRWLHVTTNGGSSWNVRRAPFGLKTFDALSARTWVGGFRSSLGPRFLMTRSAGRRWVLHRFAAPRHWTVALIRFSSPRTGWAIFGRQPPGGHGSLFSWPGPQFRATALMRTTDGGKHWTPAGPPKPKAHKRG